MASRRLKHADRRNSILEAATTAFAAKGYDGARTLEIAEAAGVSEALLYRHFPSKQALYETVLERLAEQQDRNMAILQLPDPSTRGLVECLWRYLEACVHDPPGSPGSGGQRLLLLSLAGDGRHARLLYERAQKIGVSAFAKALEAAAREGNLERAAIAPRNAWSFLEHVGSMITSSRLSGTPAIPYSGSKSKLLREAVLFCGRGLGLKDAAIEAWAPGAPRDPSPIVPTLRSARRASTSRASKRTPSTTRSLPRRACPRRPVEEDRR